MRNAPDSSSAPVGFVLFALALGGFAIGTTEFAAMSLLPFFSEELGLDKPTAGHVISAYALGVVIGAPVIAVLGARIRRRTLLIGLMVTFALGNLLTATSGSYQFMMLSRFLSGLPHGAYFGVAALLAAELVGAHKRSQAFARVMLGLTVATIAGVPLANGIGQYFGWRWAFVLVSGLALLAAALLHLSAPRVAEPEGGAPLTELGALAKPQVWLTLAIGAIGFGGMFAVYTYLASTVLQVTNEPPAMIPLTLAVFGVGLTIGNLVAGWAADKALMPTAGAVLVWSLVALTIYPFTTGSLGTLCPAVLAIGCGGGLATALQIRLMDVAGQAQTLAAALNHSAFNFANALGPWLAGMALAAGWGLSETGWVGSLLAICGLFFWAWSVLLDRRQTPKAEMAPAE
ncbi:Inner membrane transport protein YdhP [Methyloligella halotolerans]|uniref:Inner membrane transport protein YdhP n=1 Tax=Methyloligella halotolerans TaxID=1177755 RepID=A0A1E2S342_9HYPH|nr:MFS transporter [Methyloligella halotolerans]ODA68927.1 Inner membrane transport protein YdhP [Methyloligella halotolerans]